MVTMKASSSLLIDESPLQILPSLAAAIGLNEAIVLQQIKYWLNLSKNERDGRKWVYNTVAEWQRQFPFWSEDTVKRTLKSLREKGLLITCTVSESSWDRTLWYSIDYDKLDDITSTISADCPNGECKQQQSIGATCTNGLEQNAPLFIQETTTEITTQDGCTRAPEPATPKPYSAPSANPTADAASAAVFAKMHDLGIGLNSHTAEQYGELIDQFGATAVIRGLTAAADNGKQNRFHYVRACIENAAQGRQPKGELGANDKQAARYHRNGSNGNARKDCEKSRPHGEWTETDEQNAAILAGF